MSEIDLKVLEQVTSAVRRADETFEHVGGSSRHWVRDCLFPELEKRGLTITDTDAPHHFVRKELYDHVNYKLEDATRVIDAARVVVKNFGLVTSPREDLLSDLIEKFDNGVDVRQAHGIIDAARKFKDAKLALDAHQSNEHDGCDKCNELWRAYVNAEMALFRLL